MTDERAKTKKQEDYRKHRRRRQRPGVPSRSRRTPRSGGGTVRAFLTNPPPPWVQTVAVKGDAGWSLWEGKNPFVKRVWHVYVWPFLRLQMGVHLAAVKRLLADLCSHPSRRKESPRVRVQRKMPLTGKTAAGLNRFHPSRVGCLRPQENSWERQYRRLNPARREDYAGKMLLTLIHQQWNLNVN